MDAWSPFNVAFSLPCDEYAGDHSCRHFRRAPPGQAQEWDKVRTEDNQSAPRNIMLSDVSEGPSVAHLQYYSASENVEEDCALQAE